MDQSHIQLATILSLFNQLHTVFLIVIKLIFLKRFLLLFLENFAKYKWIIDDFCICDCFIVVYHRSKARICNSTFGHTVHMLFVHGSDILRESPLAPGYLSGQFYFISVIQAMRLWLFLRLSKVNVNTECHLIFNFGLQIVTHTI